MSDKESLFSKKNLGLLSNPLNSDNPITVQVLGICSALAVTAQLKPAIVMAISVTMVLAFANVIVIPFKKYNTKSNTNNCTVGYHCCFSNSG